MGTVIHTRSLSLYTHTHTLSLYKTMAVTKKAAVYVPTGKPRGRPKKTVTKAEKARRYKAQLKALNDNYKPTGNPRGRKKKLDADGNPVAKPAYVPTGKPRGRPKKN